ncbi:MAG: hypothetical protein ACKPKO_55565, partial [Candidatus Fonsibacter sp.]
MQNHKTQSSKHMKNMGYDHDSMSIPNVDQTKCIPSLLEGVAQTHFQQDWSALALHLLYTWYTLGLHVLYIIVSIIVDMLSALDHVHDYFIMFYSHLLSVFFDNASLQKCFYILSCF